MPVTCGELLVIDDEGRHHRVYVAAGGDTRWAFYDGRAWTIQTDSGHGRRMRRRAAAHETLAAPMPATVIRVPVALGEAVTRGQTVLLLEAMKMELPLRAAHDGIVTAINCAEGELVQPGAILIEIE